MNHAIHAAEIDEGAEVLDRADDALSHLPVRQFVPGFLPHLFALAFRTSAMRTPAGRARKIAALVALLARGEAIVSNAPARALPAASRTPRRKARRARKKRL